MVESLAKSVAAANQRSARTETRTQEMQSILLELRNQIQRGEGGGLQASPQLPPGGPGGEGQRPAVPTPQPPAVVVVNEVRVATCSVAQFLICLFQAPPAVYTAAAPQPGPSFVDNSEVTCSSISPSSRCLCLIPDGSGSSSRVRAARTLIEYSGSSIRVYTERGTVFQVDALSPYSQV